MEVQQQQQIDAEALLKGFLQALLAEQSPHYAPKAEPSQAEVRDGE